MPITSSHRFTFLPCLFVASFLLLGCDGGGVSTGDSVPGGSTGADLGSTPLPAPGDIPNPGGGGGGSGGGDGGGSGGGGSGSGGGGSNGGSGGSGGGDGDGGDDECEIPGTGGTDSVIVNPGSGEDATLRVEEEIGSVSDACGNLSLAITTVNTTSFQVVLVGDSFGDDIVTRELLSPDSETLVSDNDPLFLTGAVIFDPGINNSVNALTYPTRFADDDVENGTYTQIVEFVNGENVTYNGQVIAKRDPDLSEGVLRINYFLVGDEAGSGAGRAAVDTARQRVRVLYAGMGIDVDEQVFDVSSDTGIIPLPLAGSNFYLSQTGAGNVPRYALNIFVGAEISASSDTSAGAAPLEDVLGVAPSIVGAGVPTIKSAVAISLVEHGGIDGNYSAEETEILAQTMAHEGGHFLGLFHPVECANDACTTVREGDPLSDTPTCATVNECVINGLVENNMYPTPVADREGDFIAQVNFSAQQGGVVNLQPIVD